MSNAGNSGTPVRPIALTIGLAPAVLFVLTMGQDLSDYQSIMKTLAMPVLVVEIAIASLVAPRLKSVPHAPLPIVLCLIALGLIALVTAATADDRTVSLLKTAIWFVHLAFAFSIYCLFRSGGCIDANILARDIAFGFILFTCLALVYAASNREADYNWTLYFPAYSWIRWYGYYAAAVTGLCLWGWVRGDKVSGAIAAFALGAALWTGSRGTLVAIVGGYGCSYLLFRFARNGISHIFAVVIAGVLLSTALAALVPLGDFGPQRLIGDDADSGRVAIWAKALQVVLQRPWFGWGESQFAARFPEMNLVQPHNVFLQILLSWGFVGAGLVAILSIWLGCKVYRAVNEQNAAFLLAAMNIAVFSLFDGSLYHVQSVSIFALCIAVVLATKSGDAAGGCRAPQPG
ncbi:O-antigen ligase family protein [Sphingopyxis indica]|uniref:O-antigen ligase family protein n=1 Tax=Sphingopyxis indica TaxID=436663 RepID=UPI00293921F0|nr:O-antigen ligase family protein [Sphingopyxis indica]WOF43827.1 O-antigen ligase family protein [Sphingopyxis indica]